MGANDLGVQQAGCLHERSMRGREWALPDLVLGRHHPYSAAAQSTRHAIAAASEAATAAFAAATATAATTFAQHAATALAAATYA